MKFQVLLSIMKGPKTYTREDIIEINTVVVLHEFKTMKIKYILESEVGNSRSKNKRLRCKL